MVTYLAEQNRDDSSDWIINGNRFPGAMKPASVSICIVLVPVASMRAAERGDLTEARRLGVYSLWISSAVIFTFFVICIVCMVLYVQMRGGDAVDGK